jgi:hypothetical protein
MLGEWADAEEAEALWTKLEQSGAHADMKHVSGVVAGGTGYLPRAELP